MEFKIPAELGDTNCSKQSATAAKPPILSKVFTLEDLRSFTK